MIFKIRRYELKSEAEKEKLELTNKINKLESEIKLLIPKDESDTKCNY